MEMDMDQMAKMLLVFAIGMSVVAISHYVLRLKNDNVIEQTGEAFIEHHTGYDIDFSEEE